MSKGDIVAEVADHNLRVVLRQASAITLHGSHCWRTDGNSPVLSVPGGVVAFFSHYEPRGHTLRRPGPPDLHFREPAVPVELLDDPAPHVGKWIEAVWREPSGMLRGWYHAEELAPCNSKLYVPFIGEIRSHDDGRHWRFRSELLRTPTFDCSWRNGFFAGGYGDFCVVPDRQGERLYFFFTSYHTEDNAQGVVLARMAITDNPCLEVWSGDSWRLGLERPPKPLWPIVRGWRHADPDSFWGPAVHYNRGLDRYVMLINRTANGTGDLRQEGVYVSSNATLDDPTGWTAPLKLVAGGAWYPQVIGLEPGDGDTRAGVMARFFMAGFSMWNIEFMPPPGRRAMRPLTLTNQDFVVAFGPRRCPW